MTKIEELNMQQSELPTGSHYVQYGTYEMAYSSMEYNTHRVSDHKFPDRSISTMPLSQICPPLGLSGGTYMYGTVDTSKTKSNYARDVRYGSTYLAEY